MDEALRRRWHDLAGVLGVGEDAATRVLRDLWRRYGEPHRAYHTLAHVRHVLDVVTFLRRREPVDDALAVQLAAWFHDAVYQPGAADNEARSAELATRALRGWEVALERAAHVADLVLATRAHVATDPDGSVLVDADLAILAADPDTYELYRRALRVEYRHVDDARWRRGRAAFLEGMLARAAIFATPTMGHRGEGVARRNLAGELETLR
jgi:predicted metal-dependent HD superfamily phosphohydrolase